MRKHVLARDIRTSYRCVSVKRRKETWSVGDRERIVRLWIKREL